MTITNLNRIISQLKLQRLKAVLAESIAQTGHSELQSIDEAFTPLLIDKPDGKSEG